MITYKNVYWKLNDITHISEDDQDDSARVWVTHRRQERYKDWVKNIFISVERMISFEVQSLTR